MRLNAICFYKFKALFNLNLRKSAVSYNENYILISNERGEVKNT